MLNLRVLLFAGILAFICGCTILFPTKTTYTVKFDDPVATECSCDVIPMKHKIVHVKQDTIWKMAKQPVGVYTRLTCPGFFPKTSAHIYKTGISFATFFDGALGGFGTLIFIAGAALDSKSVAIIGGAIVLAGVSSIIIGKLLGYENSYFEEVTVTSNTMEPLPVRKKGENFIVPLKIDFDITDSVTARALLKTNIRMEAGVSKIVNEYITVNLGMDSMSFIRYLSEGFAASGYHQTSD